jgi:cytochrome c peroxidase
LARSKAWLVATALITLLMGGFAIAFFVWHSSEPPSAPSTAQEQTAGANEPITPLPLDVALDVRKVELGERLFHEPKLSENGLVSCASCHNLSTGGVDRLRRSRGIGGKEGVINAPTVFNSGFNFRQFWDGRSESLEDQVNGPLQSPIEMAGSWSRTIAMLSEDRQYRAEFSAIYPDGIKPQNVRDAIAAFERSLVTPNSRFDRFLRGDLTTLNQEEQAGFQLFKSIGCISCHQGVNIGGNLYQKLGIMGDYFAARGHVTAADFGLFNVTGKEADRHFFKVPSLRNVAATPPYLHDGSAMTMEDAIIVMARYQLGKELDPSEVSRIAAFLHSLSGEYRGKPLE